MRAKRLDGLSAYRKPAPSSTAISMDLNENFLLNPGTVSLSPDEVRRYPREEGLAESIAMSLGVTRENLLLFNGASEGIMCASLAFVNRGSRVLISEPEFALIPHYLTLAGAVLVKLKLSDKLEFNLTAIGEILKTGVKVFFTSAPHNPSGAVLEKNTVVNWCRMYRKTLFIVDEAYAGFKGSELAAFAPSVENLLVIRSFSKDSAIAGLRLGAATACTDLIDALETVRTPFSINAAAIKAGVSLGTRSNLLINEKVAELAERTGNAGFTVKRGAGNFFLITCKNARKFCTFCSVRGVVLREFSDGTVRISPSDSLGNEKYLACLNEWKEMRKCVK